MININSVSFQISLVRQNKESRKDRFEDVADFWRPGIGDIRLLRHVIAVGNTFSCLMSSLLSLAEWILKAKPIVAFLDNEVVKIGVALAHQALVDFPDYLILDLLVALDDGTGSFLLLLCQRLGLCLHVVLVRGSCRHLI